MKTIKIEAGLGYNIKDVVEKAKFKAIEENVIIEFDFNGILCKVSEKTNIDYLLRDYSNAHLMEWKTINGLKEYSEKLKTDIKTKQEERAEKSRLETIAYRKKEAEEKETFQKLIKGIEFKVKNQKEYNDWKDKNKDGYSACIFEYAENWGKMLQTKLPNDNISLLMEDFDLQPNYLGITGFQHGAATQILKKCWAYL
ncbi:hypothetical protein G1K97_13490 [Tenacibaculum finnmarkense]|uniref:hypothetical protein n=1 Tax=Tenacibaculum finnmarkense TaxID=2781243 RepID=UPI001EFBBA95|nr:hypothetical protein [Tenacibaculum finnmarkense]MCG8894768.1 hypothetical protein [Tenacibaculum finnmarkense]MCG8902842.1 hypothetical protein [Tenacibaculum finnmarkense]